LYFKVSLPEDPQSSPLMFLPQMPSGEGIIPAPDVMEKGKTFRVVQAPGPGGGVTRMELDPESHIHRITSQTPAGPGRILSTIQVVKETFGAKIADSAFTYKPPKDAKEIPAPAG